jgi:probable HAF family extracellular repeat protein
MDIEKGRSLVARTLLATVAVVAIPAVASAVTKTPKDLGTLGGSSSFARGLNNLGVVVGDASTSSEETHAFVFKPGSGSLTDLGTLGGGFSSASDINNLGLAVGVSKDDPNAVCNRAVVWDTCHGNHVTVLPDLDPSAPFGCSAPSAINDAGQIVGTSNQLPVLWSNGHVISLGSLGNGGFAVGINDRGDIVGQSTTASFQFHAFLWRQGVMTDIGTLGGDFITVGGINNRGQIAGYGTDASGQFAAFVWQDGVFHILPSFGGYANARAITNGGLLAGEALVGNDIHGVFWNQAHQIQDLSPLPGSTFSAGFAVNEGGLVAGVSSVDIGSHAVVWR